VLFDARGRVLLVHQDYGHHRWTFPGGIVEAGEAPAEAAAREVREEVGVEVELGPLVGAYYIRRPNPGIRFVFHGRVADDAVPVRSDDELDDMGWFDPDALPEPTTPAVPVALADARAGRSGVARTITP